MHRAPGVLFDPDYQLLITVGSTFSALACPLGPFLGALFLQALGGWLLALCLTVHTLAHRMHSLEDSDQ